MSEGTATVRIQVDAMPLRRALEKLARELGSIVADLATHRCPGCYLPMRHSFMCEWWRCDLCGTALTDEALADRSVWRRRLDWLMGMEF